MQKFAVFAIFAAENCCQIAKLLSIAAATQWFEIAASFYNMQARTVEVVDGEEEDSFTANGSFGDSIRAV
ncbi:hypothetical protein U1Q18_037686 [Sarracenia purpurea var. burkii]